MPILVGIWPKGEEEEEEVVVVVVVVVVRVEMEVKAVQSLVLGSGSSEDVEQMLPLQLHRLELGLQALEVARLRVVPLRAVLVAHH